MNIHFKDEKLFKELLDSTIFKLKVGSHLYGLNNENSDTDYLLIYVNGRLNNYDFLDTNHQLQYKHNGKDYIFTTLKQFVNNILSGDSTLNFEFIHSEELKESILKELYENREIFYNYNILKSYLGLAKRDLKILKRKNQFSGKKASHFVRGVMAVESIINKTNLLSDIKNNILLLSNLKKTNNIEEVIEVINRYEEKMIFLRDKINEDLNNQKIEKNISVSNALLLNKIIYKIVSDDLFKKLEKEYIDFSDLYIRGHIEEKFNY